MSQRAVIKTDEPVYGKDALSSYQIEKRCFWIVLPFISI